MALFECARAVHRVDQPEAALGIAGGLKWSFLAPPAIFREAAEKEGLDLHFSCEVDIIVVAVKSAAEKLAGLPGRFDGGMKFIIVVAHGILCFLC